MKPLKHIALNRIGMIRIVYCILKRFKKQDLALAREIVNELIRMEVIHLEHGY